MATKQNSGVVDGSGNPFFDRSGNPIMSGRFPDEDEITARGRARNAAMFRSFANRLTGKKEEAKKPAPAVSAGPAAGTSNLRDPQQMAASKAKPAGSRPTRPSQQVSGAKPAAKAKPAIVTKEQLAKSGFTNLRDYLNDQKKLKRRDGKAPEKAKPSTSATGAAAPRNPQQNAIQRDADTQRTKRSIGDVVSKTALPIEKPRALTTSSGVLRQREADEKRREERKEFGRQRNADKKAADEADSKSLRDDPRQQELRAKRASEAKMSSGQRSAARGAKIKEFFGMKKGGKVCMASKRADGIAVKGKTRGKVY